MSKLADLHRGQLRRSGFSLVELLTVVAIIAILAAIAVPAYIKYVRAARTSEAVSNLSAVQTFEEAYFSENDQYVTTDQNPVGAVPTSGNRKPFDLTVLGWDALGRVMPDGRQVYFQYQVTAGAVDGAGAFCVNDITGTCNAGAIGGHQQAAMAGCTGNIGFQAAFNPGNADLGINATPNTFWFFVTAVGDQDGDTNCSLFLAVTDRPDITIEEKIE